MMNDVESKAIQNKYSDEEDEAFCTKVNCFAAITIPSFLGKYSHYDKFLNSNLPPYMIDTSTWNSLHYILHKTIYLFQSCFHSSWRLCVAPVQITHTVYILWQQKDSIAGQIIAITASQLNWKPQFISIIYHSFSVIIFAPKTLF